MEEKHEQMLKYANGPSLEEVNATVDVPKNAGFWRTLFAFSGPGALVAVGYMDPGNWITSIEGGSRFEYTLLSFILLSSLIAMLLQYMAAKLGIVTRMDLAQATRHHTGKKLGITLWVTTELAIMATDIAEIIGSAVALELLFHIPLLLGVIITVFDVMLLLLLQKLGFRKVEAIVVTLIAVILIVFAYEVLLSNPNWASVVKGYVPQTKVVTNGSMLTVALGIVGATVMPHNLYLHSAISQTRKIDYTNEEEVARAVRFAGIDSNIQLAGAFVINSLLLILGASMFFGHGDSLGRFVDLYNALSNDKIVGAIASPVLSVLFAIALLASGQNSTITGTLTGEVVMEGFLHLKMPLWLRRVVTRGLAVTPVIICVILYGGKESAVESLLLYSQVFLSIALPISMIPLTIYTSDKKLMGRFVNSKWVSVLSWVITIVLTLLNIRLVYETLATLF
ncbi:manganese transport protein [Pilibacter termitis]|uniref:Divalent metal cation transporter MntH n=1 Tax=Pilibacter termitis TaxID=263852 RepID=A0A1T4LV18_9ENTE|nr:Nramp family divalent metal transporter [Pilibacter termitis]SJZ58589.1 manganese transport protein [Pilibacter termitis]